MAHPTHQIRTLWLCGCAAHFHAPLPGGVVAALFFGPAGFAFRRHRKSDVSGHGDDGGVLPAELSGRIACGSLESEKTFGLGTRDQRHRFYLFVQARSYPMALLGVIISGRGRLRLPPSGDSPDCASIPEKTGKPWDCSESARARAFSSDRFMRRGARQRRDGAPQFWNWGFMESLAPFYLHWLADEDPEMHAHAEPPSRTDVQFVEIVGLLCGSGVRVQPARLHRVEYGKFGIFYSCSRRRVFLEANRCGGQRNLCGVGD